MTMRLCNSRIPEEHIVCYQTSQCNWVIIKVLYRCLRWFLLSWHRSRIGFFIVRVVSNIIVQVRLQLDLESYGVWIGYGVVSK